MPTYSYGQLEGLWDAAGGPPAEASTAAAIAEAESGGNSLAAYPGTTVAPGAGSTTDATGLWQILGLPAGNFTAAELTNPIYNAEMAVAKYDQAGDSFSPWQTYDQGNYTVYSNVKPVKWTGEVPAGNAGTSAQTTAAMTPDPLSDPLGWLFDELFGGAISSFKTDVTDWLERGALIVFGAIIIIVGLVMMFKTNNKQNINLYQKGAGDSEGLPAASGEEAAEDAAIA